MAGYIRNDVTDQIANGNTIDAAPLDGEFDAVQSAFAAVGGHKHDGSVGEGAPITTIGPAQDIVASGNSLTPKTDNTIDLGSPTLEWKDLYVDGVANIDSLVADTADINAGTIDGTVIGGSSAAAITGTTVTATNLVTTNATVGGVAVTTASNTQTLTNKTVNLTNNTLVATSAQMAAAVTDETGSGALVFATSPALSGVPTAPTAAAATNTTQVATTAHVFAERTNTATLTNKTLTSPVVNTPTISNGSITGATVDNSVIGGVTPAAATFTSVTANGTINFLGATVSNGGSVTTVDINGGTIDGTTIGTTAAAAGTFTTGTFGLGAAGTPSITITGNPNTGLWSPGTDALALSTGGVERVRVGSTGNMGVGGVATGTAILDLVSTTKGFRAPSMTTAQRDAIVSPATGLLIYNTTLNFYQVFNGTSWTSVGGGATGGGSNQIFWENDQNVTTNYTITNGKNAMSAGRITINSGITVTVGDGEVWTVV